MLDKIKIVWYTLGIMVKVLTIENFNEETKNGVCVIDFWASWCGPCRMLSPVIDELSEEHPEVKFYKVNTDEESDLAQAFGISSIPAVFKISSGKIIARHVGYAPKAAVASALGL